MIGCMTEGRTWGMGSREGSNWDGGGGGLQYNVYTSPYKSESEYSLKYIHKKFHDSWYDALYIVQLSRKVPGPQC